MWEALGQHICLQTQWSISMKNIYQQVLLHFPQAAFQHNTGHAVQQGSDTLVKILEAALPKYHTSCSKVLTPLVFPFRLKLFCV